MVTGEEKSCEEEGLSDDSWVLRAEQRFSMERSLAGNLLHRFGCHIVVTWRRVYMLAGEIKTTITLNI